MFLRSYVTEAPLLNKMYKKVVPLLSKRKERLRPGFGPWAEPHPIKVCVLITCVNTSYCLG